MPDANARESRFLTAADGSRIAFHTHGVSREGPVVILTNGIGTTEHFWRFLVEDLGRDCRVVHWDYPGHGQSPASASGDYRLVTLADHLARVTREVAPPVGPPPVHIGFSMGVMVVLEFYRAHPEMARGLGLIAGAATPPGPLHAARGVVGWLTPVVPHVAPLVHALLRSGVVDPMARALGILQPHAPRDDIDLFLDGLTRMDAVAYWKTLQEYARSSSVDVLPRVGVPVSIVAARQDTMMPLRQVRQLREALPRAAYVEIDGAGHAGLLEQGPRMVAAMRGLLAQVAAAG